MSEHATTLVRREWEEGDRRLERERGDPRRYQRLLDQVAIVTEELRKQVGQTYSLDELAASYRDAERWARQAVGDRAPTPGWPRDLSLVLAAAFYAYQRGALDFRP
jgi:hypothetical protein